jgi:hypothetical protein
MVGVHQITEVLKETEGLAHLTTIKKVYEPGFADAAVQAYLAAMGVGEPVMTLLRKTPASSIRWLSLPEIAASNLATEALDAAAPVLTTGANGLNGRAFEGDPPRSSPIMAKGAASDGGVETTLTYRRGGGAVEIARAARDEAMAPKGWTLTGAGDPLHLQPPAGAPTRAAIPRVRFCDLAHDGKLVFAQDGGAAGAGPVALDLAGMDGAAALIAEACP